MSATAAAKQSNRVKRTKSSAEPDDDPWAIIEDLRAQMLVKDRQIEAYYDRREKIKKLREKKTALKSKLKEVSADIEAEVDELLIDEQPSLFTSESENGDGGAQAAEAWRDVRLDTLSLSDAILKKLEDSGVETLGQLTDYTKDGKPLTFIEGIGPAAVEKIDAATEVFWKEWKEKHGEDTAVDESGDGGDEEDDEEDE